jgi:hypothetical protein
LKESARFCQRFVLAELCVICYQYGQMNSRERRFLVTALLAAFAMAGLGLV